MAGVPLRTMDRIARLPGVAYGEPGAFMLTTASPAGHPDTGRPGQVTTWALIHNPPQSRAIIVAGLRPSPSRAGQVMINEAAARILGAHVGSVIQLRGFRPSQLMAVLNNEVLHPTVTLPDVRVTAIIRTSTDLGDSGAPSDVIYTGTGSLFLTAAFYHRFAGSVANIPGLAFHLDRGLAGLPAFESAVNRLTGHRAQFELGSDDATAAAAAQRGTSLQALALLLFGIVVALAMLVIVGQSVARLAYVASDDLPVLRALGSSRGQLITVALAPGALVAAAGMVLAIPAAYALSVFTPVGLARQAEISPGFSFDAPILLGGAVLLMVLLSARAVLAAQRVVRSQADTTARRPGRGSRIARWMARQGCSPCWPWARSRTRWSRRSAAGAGTWPSSRRSASWGGRSGPAWPGRRPPSPEPGLIIGLPLGAAAGRWAWTALAQAFAIEPVPVISAGLLLAVPAVLVLANAVAAIPARTAARTRPGMVLRAE